MPANSDARPAATCHHRVLAMTYPDPPQTGLSDFTPSLGELALEDRSALRRVAGLSTELADVSEVEYRQLRLERVVLVGVWTEGSAADNRASLAELAALAETAGSQVLEGLIQRRDKPDPSTYIGSGKAAELREVIVATGADTVICDGELSPAQLTALEKAVQVKVIDRTALILDIFAQHATSREGKAQVSLAQMEYMLPRLRGWGESMSRQAGGRAGGSGGGVGLRGPGETKIETDRRRIRERMAKLRRDIRAMKQVRDTQRSRRRHSDVPSIAIVGYTNAGKSSLLNALTGAGVLVQDALFATLEPTTRRAEFGDGRPVVLTDTVGFVRHLPTQLVEAFRSTLEEVVHADLLVHVVDGSDGHPLAQIDAVRQVISEVIADHDGDPPPELLVVNKVDVASDLMLAKLRHGLPGAVFVSARTGDGIDALRRRMAELVVPADTAVDVVIPYDRGDLVARVHADRRLARPGYLPTNRPVGIVGHQNFLPRRASMGSATKYQRTLFEPEHELFRESYRAFLDRHVAPYHDEWEKTKIVDRGVWLEAGKQGFLGMAVPEEYGGGGNADFRYNTVITEETCAGRYSGIGFGLHNDIVAPYLLALATEEQKRRWFPNFCTGELITAIAMTEPGTGSDLQGITTRAVKHGDHYVLNGSKTFITNGINSDLVIVVAQTDPEKGAQGFSLLVVERGMAGFERGRQLDKIGLDAQDTAELSFTDVAVPAENLLGQEGMGFIYLMQNLPQERISIAIMAAAGMESVLEQTLQYAKERKAFGRSIGSFQNSRFLLAELATEATVVRIMVDEFIKLHLAGKLTAEQAAMAKWYATEKQVYLNDRCLQLHGGYGYMREYPVARAYLDSRVQTIYGGTTEIMKEIIGRGLGV